MNTENFGMDQNRSSDTFREGPVARKIEEKTAKIPSDVFLWAAGGSIVLSLLTQVLQPRSKGGMPTRAGQLSLFIGQWAPTFLLLGVYNKIVKVMGGSDHLTADLH